VPAALRAPHPSGCGGIIRVGTCSSESCSVGAPHDRQNLCAVNNSNPQFLQCSAIGLKTVSGFWFVVSGLHTMQNQKPQTKNKKPETRN
jgi:hypothetical protein